MRFIFSFLLSFIFWFIFWTLSPSLCLGSVNIQNFEHTSSYSFENMSGARVLDSYLPIESGLLLGAGYSYDRNPLVIENLSNNQRVGVLIQSFQTLHLTAGYRLSDVLTLGFDSAVVRTAFQSGKTDVSLSDSRVSANYTFYQRGKWALGLQGLLDLPTGKGADHLSNSSSSEQVLLAISHEGRPVSVSVNAGYVYCPSAQDDIDPLLDYRKRLVTEIGAIHPFNDRWSAIGEFHRYWTLPFNKSLNPNELYLGARDQWSESLALFAGATVGTFDRISSNEWRVLAGLKWAPDLTRTPKQQPAPAPSVKDSGNPVCAHVSPPDLKFTLHFDNAKFSLDDLDELDRMEKALESLQANIEHVDVVGHTSIVGSDAYNLRLSIRRAAAVRAYLVREGETSQDIHTEGEGSKQLLDPAMNETAHQKNRRVEIIIHQKKSEQKCQ